MKRATVAKIHHSSIIHNYRLACQLAPDSANLAVIKANAYGHGLSEVAQLLEPMVPAFAVAILDEALTLRQQGIVKPVVILEGVDSPEGMSWAARHNCWPILHTKRQLAALTNADSKPRCWVKLDTGMHRLGFAPPELADVVEQVRGLTATSPVICTHFARADELDNPMTTQQLNLFRRASRSLGCSTSLANSPALLGHPAAHSDWNRPGLMLYGCSPFSGPQEHADQLQAAMTLESEIIAIRNIPSGDSVGYGSRWQAKEPARIATLAIGYADGYPRHSQSQCRVWLHNQYAPLAGTVSMDMVTIDVSHIPETKEGDKVELWGPHVPVTEVARHNGTINYELLTRVSQRVPRVYID
ncbi:alanine racemase [Saliniradius amylolyticus]|nr:alanine racemase [Saliniradius amylolyticus]